MAIIDTSMTLVAAHKGWKLWLSMRETDSRELEILISPPDYMPDFADLNATLDATQFPVATGDLLIVFNRDMLTHMNRWQQNQPRQGTWTAGDLEVIRAEALRQWQEMKHQIDAEYEVRPW